MPDNGYSANANGLNLARRRIFASSELLYMYHNSAHPFLRLIQSGLGLDRGFVRRERQLFFAGNIASIAAESDGPSGKKENGKFCRDDCKLQCYP